MTTGEAPSQGSGRRPVSVWALMLGTGPRFARDAFGPVVVFYVGWKTIGLGTGTVAATLVAVGAFGWERWHARAGLSAFFGLGIALVEALGARTRSTARIWCSRSGACLMTGWRPGSRCSSAGTRAWSPKTRPRSIAGAGPSLGSR
jgi:hypothetical protein